MKQGLPDAKKLQSERYKPVSTSSLEERSLGHFNSHNLNYLNSKSDRFKLEADLKFARVKSDLLILLSPKQKMFSVNHLRYFCLPSCLETVDLIITQTIGKNKMAESEFF